MPTPPSISRFAGLFLLWAAFGVARLGAEEATPPPPAEMLLDLELLMDRDFAGQPSDLSRPRVAEETELVENLDWLDTTAERSPVGR